MVADGNESAFREIFDRYYDKLYHYSLSVAKSPELAEEIVSDVFVKLWLGRAVIAEINNIESFLIHATRNRSIDFLRQAARHQRLQHLIATEFTALQNPNDRLDTADLQRLVEEALQLLNPVRRKIFELHRNEGMTHHQIALQLQISPHTVRNNISASLQFIRNFLSSRGIAPCLMLCYFVVR